MSRYHCSCGFATGDPDDLGDHLRIAFSALDDTGTDGHQHYELADHATPLAVSLPDGYSLPAYACACGFATDDTAAFDDHLLGVFITPNRVGADGRTHVLAGSVIPWT